MAISVPTVKPVDFSETLTFFEGGWHAGNVPIMGPRTHGAWLASTVFDGARAFEGVAPDLDRHCERVNRSAVNFKLKPVVDTETWLALAREGIARFDAKAELYIRPMYWAQTGSGGGVLFDPETTNWCLHLCSSNAADHGLGDYAIAVPPADDGKRAGGLQGGLSLPE
jgi:branched-chain amino acid aminotransferase